MRASRRSTHHGGMQTNIHEIADGVYRLSTLVPEAAPGGFTFNQYLIVDEEPLLFHTGARQLFPLVSEAVVEADRRRRGCAGSASATSSPTRAAP